MKKSELHYDSSNTKNSFQKQDISSDNYLPSFLIFDFLY